MDNLEKDKLKEEINKLKFSMYMIYRWILNHQLIHNVKEKKGAYSPEKWISLSNYPDFEYDLDFLFKEICFDSEKYRLLFE